MFYAPRHLPPFADLLRASLDRQNTPDDIARHLGITRRTLARWQAQGDAPRAVLLVLYWESHYGRAEVSLYLHNEAQHWRQMSRFNEAHIERLRDAIARCEAEGSDGAANAPTFNTR